MTAETESLWRGLLEVCPVDPGEFPDDMVGAFVLVAARANSRDQFVDLVRHECEAQRLHFMDIEDVVGDATEDDLEECMHEELRAGAVGVVLGTFHMYPADA